MSAPLEDGEPIAPGYEVIRHMRRGRALDVYDVWSQELGARCIVKAVRPERRDDERTRQRLLEEGRRLERIRHPHIVRGYETLEEPRPLVVMETLSGATLAHLVESSGEPLAVEEVAHLGLQLGSAIRYLHSLGILHLDLKPANVVAEAGRVKLIDLSLARAPGQVPAGVGTWCYLAPEQASDGFVGPPADVWGIGTVLFEAATGQPAFDDPDAEEPSDSSAGEDTSGGNVADEPPDDEGESGSEPSWLDGDDGPYPQLTDRPARIDELREAPPALADLVVACLEPEPGARPEVEALLAALEAFSGLPAGERRWTRRAAEG